VSVRNDDAVRVERQRGVIQTTVRLVHRKCREGCSDSKSGKVIGNDRHTNSVSVMMERSAV